MTKEYYPEEYYNQEIDKMLTTYNFLRNEELQKRSDPIWFNDDDILR